MASFPPCLYRNSCASNLGIGQQEINKRWNESLNILYKDFDLNK
tara:strand:- start:51 stop:182 length:132 start_codon:yes stop_codon:yes gene_type:complete